MKRPRLNAIGGFFLAALLVFPALAADVAQPGTVNYVEGQVFIGAQPLNTNSIGSTHLAAGQSITTANGKAEILLTPGVFVRLAESSSLTMISPDLANTEVRLRTGRAIIEVAELHKENHLVVDEDGAPVRLVKTGLYSFDANQNEVRVFKGQAIAQKDGRDIKIKGGRELSFNGPLKAQKFDKENYEDSFYRWASLRSEYLAEANVDAARFYDNGGYGAVGGGWYWDPWFDAYTFLPGTGVFYSPFGWNYYSPGFAFAFPFGYYGHTYHHFSPGLDRDFGHRAFGRGPGARPGFGGNRGFGGFGGFGGRGMNGFNRAGGIHGGGHGGGGRGGRR